MKQFNFMILALCLLFFVPAHCADTLSAENEKVHIEVEPSQDFQVPAPEMPVPNQHDVPQQAAVLGPFDYGIVGAITLGVMGLLTYMIKSDRMDRKDLVESMKADRKELVGAIDALRISIQEQRQSQDRLSSEINAMLNMLKGRVDDLEDSIKRIEDTLRNDSRRSNS